MKRLSGFCLSINPTLVVLVLAVVCLSIFTAQFFKASHAEDVSLTERITALKVFAEPLVPIGGAPSKEESEALLSALNKCDVLNEEYLSAEEFLIQRPQSVWRGSLLTNLGLTYFAQGYYSKALSTYEKAWNSLKDEKQSVGKAFADRALGEWLMLLARLGRKDQLENIFAQIKGRELTGVSSERVTGAREGLTQMQTHPEDSYLCGPYALKEVAEKIGLVNPETILSLPSTHKGTSLDQIFELSQRHGLKLKRAFRTPNSKVVYPAVIHWKAGHFAPIIDERDNQFLVKDITFLRNSTWVSRKAIENEASGYVLIPDGPLPEGWREVSKEEARLVWGKGRTGDSDPSQTAENEVAVGGNCSAGMGTAPQWKGMAQYKIQAMLVSLSIVDIPVGYDPPVGDPVHCKVIYNQREDNQPTIFTFFNFGQKWNFNFSAYILDKPTALNSPFTVFLRGGGSEVHDMNGSEISIDRDIQTRSRVIRKSRSPIVYERELPDGSKEIYSESDGSAGGTRRVFLKQIVDPQGNTITLSYDRSTNAGVRLVSIVDAIGQRTTISYELPSDPLRVTKITDPFGRSATFTYTNNKLTKITDVIGLTSEFGYQGQEDFINTLKTPYETTTFTKQDPTSSNKTYRWLEATDSAGRTERAEFRHSAPGMTDQDLSLDRTFKLNDRLYYRNTFYWDKEAYRLHVKGKDLDDSKTSAYLNAKIFHFYHTTQNITSGIIESIKTPLQGREFFLLSNTRKSDITFMTPDTIGNAPTAVIRWLDDGTTEEGRVTTRSDLGHILEDIDAVGRTTKYTYDSNNIDILKVERGEAVVEGGALVFKNLQTVLTLSDYVKHLPQVIRDASGRETRLKYNARGQVETVTNPKGEVTTIKYYPTSYIERITSSDPQINTSFTYDNKGRVRTVTDGEGYATSYEYDDLDRLKKTIYLDSTFEELGYNRLDLETYRDRQGRTTTQKHNAWRQLEEVLDAKGQKTSFSWCGCGSPESITDSKGQKTSFTRDIEGRITKKTFADGSFISYQYEARTSRLKTLTYPNGQPVNYEYFEDGNIKTIRYPRFIATGRDPIRRGSGRRISTSRNASDPVGLEKSESVKADKEFDDPPFSLANYAGAEASEAVAEASEAQQASSPGQIAFTYDLVFNRVKTMTDETGLTTYDYYPSDGFTLGAGFLKSIDGPLSNDTTTYEYDELGRVRKKTLNGSVVEAEYDVAGRIWKENNSRLGNFLYDYVPGTGRLRSITRGNGGFARNYEYFPYTQEARLKTLKTQWGSSVASQFDYTYFDAGAVKSWSISGLGRYDFGYDQIDQLRTADLKNSSGALISSLSYDYDAAGNRTKEVTPSVRKDAAPNNLNQITNVREFATSNSALLSERRLDYDKNGNLKEIAPISGGPSTKFEWDALNRLTTIYYPSGRRTRISYDGSNRWTKILEIENDLVLSSKDFIWCGLSLCEERSSRGVKRFFPQGFVDYDGRSYFYGRDHLGSVRDIFDGNGNIIARYQYDPYGKRTTLFQNGPSADFGFTGHYLHEFSGLQLAPFRAYSAELGRWISRDPIGESGGLNLYRYAANSPHSAIDPTGAIPIWDIIDIGFFIEDARQFYNDPSFSNAGWVAVSGVGLLPIASTGWIRRVVGGADEVRDAVRTGEAACDSGRRVGQSVIGHYPDYINVANELSANRFSIPESIWNAMTGAERWAANQRFLDRAIRRGDEFVLATPLDQVRPGSYLSREIDYLLNNGYRIGSEGRTLIPR